jgi:hypothetical protein
MRFNLKLALLWTAYLAAALGIVVYEKFDPRNDSHWWSAVPLLLLTALLIVYYAGRAK